MKDLPPARCGGVDRFRERPQPHSPTLKALNRRYEFRERAEKTIEAPNDDRVTGPGKLQCCCKLRPKSPTGGNDLLKDFFATSPSKRMPPKRGVFFFSVLTRPYPINQHTIMY
jgi:hypothetical protein